MGFIDKESIFEDEEVVEEEERLPIFMLVKRGVSLIRWKEGRDDNCRMACIFFIILLDNIYTH